MNEERLYWLGFSVFPGIGPVKFNILLAHYGSAKSAWETAGVPLARRGLAKLIGTKTAEKFSEFQKDFSVDAYAEKLEKKKVSFLTLADPEYPSLLKQTTKPPYVLYVKGDLGSIYSSSEVEKLSLSSRATQVVIPANAGIQMDPHVLPEDDNKITSAPMPRNDTTLIISVVGTRKITQYGRDVTQLITFELVGQGFTIVSGLAMGVDAVAHQTAIDNGGKTIAVLGCGVDCCTPEENTYLYDSIIEHGGCILSELPLGHPPSMGSFPARNRIVAGLSIGTVVTEGAEDSGALITADFALQYGRKAFAVPGPITSSLSKGPYKLIEKGGKLVTSVQDILNELKVQNSKLKTTAQNSKRKESRSSAEEEKILEILANEPLHFDEIVRRSKMSSSQAGSLLSLMEVKGIIRSVDGGFFAITS